MKTRYSPLKLRTAAARSLNIRLRAVLAMAFILALVVAPTLIPPNGLLSGTRVEAATSPTGSPSADKQTRARFGEAFGKLPLYFVENRGQIDKRVGYYVQGSDKTIYFTNQGLTFVLNPKPETRPEALNLTALQPAANLSLTDNPQSEIRNPKSERWALKLDFVGARAGARPEGKEQTGATFSYFKGSRSQWQAGLKSYSQIVYRDLWQGIDLVYAGTVNRMKYTFVVKPGADPNRIKLAWRGASGVKLNAAGELEVTTPAGGFTDERPVSWQQKDGRQVDVTSAYQLEDRGSKTENGFARSAIRNPQSAIAYGFKIEEYDRSRELVIDPAVLVYCGYIGGSGDDQANGIAVDSAGNAYVTGQTLSTGATFPVTVGPDLTYNGGGNDAFVAKVNVGGTALVYCGYIGGDQPDNGFGIAVDSAGNAYVTGLTQSTQATFPVTVGPDLTYNGNTEDGFVAKVNASGTALDYCGYIGGSNLDHGNGIAVDSSGNAYIVGQTAQNFGTFPVTVGPDLTHNGGGNDAYVAKVNASGTALDYCGYIGGNGSDRGLGIAVDSAGNAYVTGLTQSTEASFPVTIGPDLIYNGSQDGFVAKVNAGGTALDYCGYIGGSNLDQGNGIAVDSAGNAYVTGNTFSTEATFPVTVGPDLIYNGNQDGFVAKVNAGGTALDYCGYIGGSSSSGDSGAGIAVDSAGNAYVTGLTGSSEATFPVTGGPDLTYNGGFFDAYVAKVNASGTALVYCGYIGGNNQDGGSGIAVDSAGNAYITGVTRSPEASFPVTGGPVLTFNGGTSDAFVAKISPPTPQDQILALIAEVQALITAGTLTQNQGDALINKLDQVIAKLDNDQTGAACNQLDAFINQVNAFINNGSLTAAQGQALIDAVNAIKADIGC